MKEVEQALERIEYANRTFRSDFAREQAIWEDIAMNINSCEGEEQKFWLKVMDLYKKKQI